ncbi:MAG TPA: hypothetical protein VN931_04155 [Fibrobacteria bacterium]|nr:hypothetical protein [Fibrobacteria bacterium]
MTFATAFLRCLLVPLAAMGQVLPSQGDPRPLGEVGRPVSIAGSPFEVWVAYPHSMVVFARIGPPRPRWYGSEQGLPDEGIASLCFDDGTQSLWIGSNTGRSLRWTQGLESAQETALPPGGCSNRTSRPVAVSDLPPLFPSSPGWLQSAGDLIGPDGLHQHVRFGLVLDGRDLWIATDRGIWTGSSTTGRISPVPSGLAESCVVEVLRDSSGGAWLLGCQGSISVVDASDHPLASFLPDDPQFYQLRSPHLLCPAGPDGIWVSVQDGILRLDPRGLQESWTGRKAPFGGRTRSCLEFADTLWCGTENSLVRKSSSDRSFRGDPPPWSGSSPVNTLLSTPLGLLATTDKGFWWDGPGGWKRPPFLSGESSPIQFATSESVEPWRIAWSDGRVLKVDTLPGHPGSTASWIPDRPITGLSFDGSGRLHLAIGGSWSIWNPTTDDHREWRSGLGLSGSIDVLSIWGDRVILAGTGGAVSVRIAPYAPSATSPK